jgi:peptide chain release factor 3
MSFEYDKILINLLDTPGHKDFAEDTYRTLTAVDSVILVVDSVNGVEEQTRRLMEVCRMRDTPVIVFINKMDRDGKNRFDLLEEIEKELSIALHPMTWPINSGKDFKGVYDLDRKSLLLFTANTKADEDSISISDIHDKVLDEKLGERDAAHLREDVELVDTVHGKLNTEDYLAGKVAPVFFGSAINNFGVKEMLDTFIRIAPTPRSRETTTRMVDVEEEKLTGTGSLFSGYAVADLSAINIFIMCGWTKRSVSAIPIPSWPGIKASLKTLTRAMWWVCLILGISRSGIRLRKGRIFTSQGYRPSRRKYSRKW